MEKETKGTRTKRYIYQCAIRLFREKGYDQVSVDEIMHQAGMAKGTFYIYFRSKSDIILEMLCQYDDYYDRIFESLDPEMPVSQKMEEIVKGACRFTEEVIGQDLIRVLYTKNLKAGAEHKGLLNEDRALFRILTGLIREGQRSGEYRPEYPAEETAMLILRNIRAVFFEWCSTESEGNLADKCLWSLQVLGQGYRYLVH